MIDVVVDIVAAILEAFASWRLYFCVVVGAVVIGAIFWWMPGSLLRTVAAISLGVLAFAVGVVWEWRAT